jgi:hypothetical protein
MYLVISVCCGSMVVTIKQQDTMVGSKSLDRRIRVRGSSARTQRSPTAEADRGNLKPRDATHPQAGRQPMTGSSPRAGAASRTTGDSRDTFLTPAGRFVDELSLTIPPLDDGCKGRPAPRPADKCLLPKDLLPFTLVQGSFYDWADNVLFKQINSELLLEARERPARQPE